jgi:hopene-associated glycosyltransferase HpnB
MRLVVKAEKEDLALVSLMAQLDARGLSGGLLIPAFVYFFQKLYPFALANDPKSSVAAAAGGVMLVRRDALQRAGGIEQIRDQLIDDCALARLLKVAGERTWIGLADAEAQSLRDNRSLRSIWSMVARTAFTQLDHSWAKLFACAAGMGLIYLAPPAIAFLTPIHGNSAAAIFALAAFFLMALSWSPTLRLFGKPGWAGFFLPVAAAFYLAMTVSSGLDHARGRGGFWKGRAYP